MGRAKQIRAMVMGLLLIVSIAGGVVALGSSALADSHTKEQAPDLTDEANFTTVFPANTDHYPGDQNTENGSIEYYSAGADAFHENDAEEGLWMNFVIIDASWIDYSACSTENTVVYGIDRGNNLSGTEIDEDLIEHTLKSTFRDDGITVEFYNWDDFAGDPPYLSPQDAQVSAQGAGSNDGPCLTVTSEPGWYQVQGFLNGTIANGPCTEEGNAECQPENPEVVGVNVRANYMYVCECDSEQEARDQLGPPPNEEGGSTPTPSNDTPAPTPTPGDTPTPEQSNDIPTPTDASGGGGDTPANTATQANAGGNSGGGANGGGNTTPTVGSGPGFGTIVAILGLLASALVLHRRR